MVMGSLSSQRRSSRQPLERAEEDARIEARMMARIKAGASILAAVNEEGRNVAPRD